MIPMNPQKRSGNPGSFSSTNMGIIGFAINGVPIFNPYDSSCCDAGLYELTALDMCYAHPNGTRRVPVLAVFSMDYRGYHIILYYLVIG